ncbi:MAG: adenylate/guanylate cyclase domain-containing protein [Acidimicrobiales bacterium]
MRACIACDGENPLEAQYCNACGAELPFTCPACDTLVAADQNFCGNCGFDLRAARVLESGRNSPGSRPPPHLARRILADRNSLIGERKRITVMFADVVGSTATTEGQDPESAAAFLNTALGAMMSAVHRYEGTVNELLGDGIVALFGAPLAHEDHAVRACLAGLEIEDAVAEATDGVARTRVGLHSGEVFVQAIGTDLSLEYQALGPTVHLAARMEQLADPGAVFVTPATRALAEGFIRTRPVGDVEVKGIGDPVTVYALTGVSSTSAWDVRAARGLTRFVSRDQEMQVLASSLQTAVEGRGQVVAMVGDPGIGKSRILHEFLARNSSGDVRSLRGHASPYDVDTSYHALKPVVRSALPGLTHRAISFHAVHAAVTKLDPDLSSIAAGLASLLDIPVDEPEWNGLSPEMRRRRIRESMNALVLAVAADRPLVLAIEDLHWLDNESAAVIDELIALVKGSPILVLVTHRPEYTHDWGAVDHCSRLELAPLAGDQADALVEALVGTDSTIASLKSHLLARGEGTPLFIEESVRSLVEAARLSGRPGEYRLVGDPTDVDLPESVQAVLAARIDRLSPDEKFVLQTASVMGETVDAARLDVISPGMDTARLVGELQQREFLNLHSSLPVKQYRFKHALVRDVAYELLPRSQRRELHGKLARHIADATTGTDEVERVAFHAEHGEIWDLAAEACLGAAEKGIDRSAYADASRFLVGATDALHNLPETTETIRQAIDIRMRQRVVETGSEGGLTRVVTILQEALDLAASIDDKERLANLNIHFGYAVNMQGHAPLAEKAGRDALELAEELSDPYLATEARILLAQNYDYSGRPKDVVEVLEGDLEYLANEIRHERFGQTMIRSVVAYSHMAIANGYMGNAEAARDHLAVALEIAGEVNRPFDLLYAHYAQGVVLDMAGDTDGSIASHEVAADIGDTYDLWFIKTFVQPLRGHALLAAGRTEDAATLLDDVCSAAERVGLPYVLSLASSFAAEAHRRLGAATRAESLAVDALAFGRMNVLPLVEIPALRTLAELAPTRRDRAELLRNAEASAERHGFGPWLQAIREQLSRE